MSERIYSLILFLWLTVAAFSVFTQQKTDTTYIFRFMPQKDMLYVPLSSNDMELVHLLESIEGNKTDILGGNLRSMCTDIVTPLKAKKKTWISSLHRSNECATACRVHVTQGRPQQIQTVIGTLSDIAGVLDMEAGQITDKPAYPVETFTLDGNNNRMGK